MISREQFRKAQKRASEYITRAGIVITPEEAMNIEVTEFGLGDLENIGLELVDVPDPQPKEDWAVVKLHASVIFTEYKTYLVGNNLPTMGHEVAGEVVAVAQSGPVKIGDRVVSLPQFPCGKCALCMAGNYIYCDFEVVVGYDNGSGGFAHYALKPAWLQPLIPEGVSYTRATMAIDDFGASSGAFKAIHIGALDCELPCQRPEYAAQVSHRTD